MARYNDFSGRSIDGLRVLTDGIFAIVMTLLVLDLHSPGTAVSSGELWHDLASIGPEVVAYVLSFTMLGTFWLAIHAVLDPLQGSDRTLAWSVLTFLFFVTTLPFTASVLADHVHLWLAVVLYWLNLAMLGAGLGWQIFHIGRARLAADDAVLPLVRRRLVLAQGLYAAATLVVVVSPIAAVVALAVVQLFFMLSPRLPWRV